MSALKLAAAGLSALVIGLIGLLGWWAGQPWLLPSLGPTIALQAASPELPASKPRHVLVGHAIGLAAGLVAVYVTGAYADPSVAGADALTLARVAAAALAVGLAMTGEVLAQASHPPAQATTLLVALGAVEPTIKGAASVVCGVLLVAAFGEAIRRLQARA
ncbi:HPP family protein [Sabulicella glaciei]|uniref:HPP family protein n=1 Tax=Sabulicella glaciei TaxID=2984948 RepID=A0ABT3P1B5_9PROT|nr:HPP family protein [Roseococcus sp. MDT2-1-1]MCW8088190.1 HPP family protein [Roseococcus sp. MDT2-1-1]